jgi:hypothetical protein
MRRMTFLLFQLFLAIFAGYAVMYDVPNKYLFVPLLCLVAMLFLGKHPRLHHRWTRPIKWQILDICICHKLVAYRLRR